MFILYKTNDANDKHYCVHVVAVIDVLTDSKRETPLETKFSFGRNSYHKHEGLSNGISMDFSPILNLISSLISGANLPRIFGHRSH